MECMIEFKKKILKPFCHSKATIYLLTYPWSALPCIGTAFMQPPF